jgi:glycosyltransferase involved in cell wall biosynthesis
LCGENIPKIKEAMTQNINQPLVSVIIPTYNRAYCIQETINSVLHQTHDRVEVLVIDDGSTDQTAGLIASQYGLEKRVRYHYQENGGVSAARNTGIRLATGDYVALLDSDDLWEPWKLELQLTAFKLRPEIGMLWTDMVAVDPSGRVISESYLRQMYSAHRWFPTDELFSWSCPISNFAPIVNSSHGKAKFYAGDIYSSMVAGNLAHTSTVLLSRERLEQVGEFKIELSQQGEDYEFHLRTCRVGPVGFLDLPTIVYQKGRADQITSKYDLGFARNFLTGLTEALEKDKSRIKLSPELINTVLADAHGWLGSTLIRANQCAEGRKHLLEALRREFDYSVMRVLVLSLLPSTVRPRLQSALRVLRNITAFSWTALVLDMSADFGEIAELLSLS